MLRLWRCPCERVEAVRFPGRWKRVVLVACILLNAIPTNAVHADAAYSYLGKSFDVRYFADWILSVQVTGAEQGMIPESRSIPTTCVPYFANLAASGLAGATRATGDSKYVQAAWSWLRWYANHMTADGYIFDYSSSNGADWQSLGTYDSTDAYAATFISAVEDAYNASGDRASLQSLWPSVVRAVGAIQSTTDDADGLTYAKPGFDWKYLLDNAEVFHAWSAVARLSQLVSDPTLHATAAHRQAQLAASLGAFWVQGAPSAYASALSRNGSKIPWDGQFYPSGVAQAWMINTGLVSVSRAQSLTTLIAKQFPEWSDPDKAGWWPSIAQAFDAAGYNMQARNGYANIGSPNADLSKAHTEDVGNLLSSLLNREVRLTDRPSFPWSTSSSNSVSFSGAGSFECAIDEGTYSACRSPFATGQLPDGSHSIEVRSIGGRQDAAPLTVAFTIDSVAPSLTLITPSSVRTPAPQEPSGFASSNYEIVSKPEDVVVQGEVRDDGSGTAAIIVSFSPLAKKNAVGGNGEVDVPLSCAPGSTCAWKVGLPSCWLTGSINGQIPLPFTVPKNMLNVQIQAIDNAGNIRTTGATIVILDPAYHGASQSVDCERAR